MSQWTHVNASIRIDGIPMLEEPITKEELGPISTWENPCDTKIPTGSEGSLEYTIIKCGGENSLACRVVCFYGDLRDYSDHEEILKYFKDIVKGKMVRSGILEIYVEYQDTLTYSYNDDSNEWCKIA